MHKGSCGLIGWEAYCCKGQPLPEIEPRDPTFGNSMYAEFRTLLELYMENPTCPGTELGEDGEDYYYNALSTDYYYSWKRSILDERAMACSVDAFESLIDWMTTLFSNEISAPAPLVYLWDDLFAGHYDDSLEFANLSRYLHSTGLDPRAVMEDILLNPLGASQGVFENEAAQDLLCELPDSMAKRDYVPSEDEGAYGGFFSWSDKRDPELSSLVDRHINPYGK